jgi:hypothetical protein
MRLRVLTSVLGLALAAGPAWAQMTVRSGERPGQYGYAGFLTVGAEQSDWTGLNDELTRTGFAALPERRFTIGAGGYALRGGVLIGAEGYAAIGDRVTSGTDRQVRAIGGGGFVELGYALVDRPHARLFPLLGLGGVGVMLDLQDPYGLGIGPNVNDPQFVDVMVNPGRRAQVSAGGLALLFGGGAEVIVGRRMTAARRRDAGLLLGVRAGYTYTTVRSDWMLYHQQITGGPDAVGGGWFVRFTVGAGGTRWRARG